MEWIDVNDRLPEKENFYLVWANSHVFMFYYGLHHDGDICWWYKEERIRRYMTPSHWQPLPQPPQTTK